MDRKMKTKQINIRFTEEGFSQLESLAGNLGLTKASLIEFLVREEVNRRGKTIYVERESYRGEEGKGISDDLHPPISLNTDFVTVTK